MAPYQNVEDQVVFLFYDTSNDDQGKLKQLKKVTCQTKNQKWKHKNRKERNS